MFAIIMNFRGIIIFLSLSVIIFISVITAPGCANIVPPQGGLRDSLPPVLVKANPKDSAVNFTGNKISFSFDEFIELQEIQRNLVITPIPQNNPTVESRLNIITVKLKDSLEANTTYTIDFGEAIQDINERNVLKNFSYRFSTGKALDSLELPGKVILAEDGKTDTTLTVMLHRNGKDSAVMSEKPRYITKLNNKGEFTFRNLPSGTFYLYALKAESSSYRYFGGNQLFAFADTSVTVQQKNEPVTLYAYAEKIEEKRRTASIPTTGRGRGPNISTAADKRLRYQTSLKENKQDLLENFSFRFEAPLKFFDSTKILFTTDTTYQAVTQPFRWVKDSTGTKLELQIDSAANGWKENTLYNLVFETNFAEDTLGRRILKKDTISFRTREKKSYGTLKLNFTKPEPDKNPVLQFVQNSIIVISYPLTSNQYINNLMNPGEYELLILYDENKNGKWDAGEFFGKRKQPELVKPVRRITIKAGFENEYDIPGPL
jgi:hypothetical protein